MRNAAYYQQQDKILKRLLAQARESRLGFFVEDCHVWERWHLFSNPQVSCSQRMYTWERGRDGEVFCKRSHR